ncbi:3-methyl-2-oxobutanoate dehydrogenase (2-methylpropanoyl-transferring) [Salvia divinorum]|uniref:3-methyl-2-oxobutanoate dehydrogenase (2-methylpropanoyl-transferring) n=1 Tax=Salvia divinorum TaxID=28513 RepID=A0ABD1FNX0_SALDI
MGSWLARSRNIQYLLKRNICFFDKTHSLLHANSSYKTLPPYETPHGFCASVLSFRRSESTMAGKQAQADDDDGNQSIEFPGGRVGFTTEMDFISEVTDKRVPCYRLLDDDGFLISGTTFEQPDRETAARMYESMLSLQIMDTIFYEAQRQGRLSFYLTSTGEEAINIATAAALSPDDIILPQYREPGILLWRGFSMEEFASQCFGTKDGRGKGRQMPVHYGSNSHNFFTVSSPIATQLPQAAGVAYSLKMDGKEACAVAFTGDGGTSEGDFHAGMNFAAVMEAPVLFICRNNGWAISTPISQQFRSSINSDGVVVKGQAYGIRSIRVDGNDALAVYSAIRAAREMVVREQKPVLVEALTYRVGHHSTSDDSTKYRSVSEIEQWRSTGNPMTRFRNWVLANGWWTDEHETELRGTIRKQVLKAIQVAEKTHKPPLEDLFSDVYDKTPSNLQEQEKSLRETINKYKQDFPADVPL